MSDVGHRHRLCRFAKIVPHHGCDQQSPKGNEVDDVVNLVHNLCVSLGFDGVLLESLRFSKEGHKAHCTESNTLSITAVSRSCSLGWRFRWSLCMTGVTLELPRCWIHEVGIIGSDPLNVLLLVIASVLVMAE